MAKKYKCLFMETSAKTGYNVNEAFLSMANAVIDMRLGGKKENAKKSTVTLLCIRYFRGESILSKLPKDVVILIAKALFKTRMEDCWRRNQIKE